MGNRVRRSEEREYLLAEIAEMYYEQRLTQSEIADAVGVTRSAISRMLTEAHELGIVEVRIHRPFRFDNDLESSLKTCFGLENTRVLAWRHQGNTRELRIRLGKVAAEMLKQVLINKHTVGIAWGLTVAAAIDALAVDYVLPVKVVQLVGVAGSDDHAYNSQALVERLARRLGGETVYLYSPFIVENAETARSLLNMPQVREAMEIGKQCDLALLGIGTTEADDSSLYQSEHITAEELASLRAAGCVGDVCGRHFNVDGNVPEVDFHNRLVGIAREDLLAIPTRIGVAGGAAKVEAILGAMRGKYINWLVTDSLTAQTLLEMDNQPTALRDTELQPGG
jgi:DNA-binding transcriptional regulator LsrR (DeoR family)